MQDPLFQPISINNLQIKNRIYMPAMHMGMADNFHVTEQLKAFYRERARGGAGMITVGYATVDDKSGSTLNIGAHKDEFIPGLAELAQTIKDNGAKSAVQLNHAGRYNFSFFMDGQQSVAPSAKPSKLTKETPRALENDEIAEIIDSFSEAALRVQKAGFDAVEVLCGTGYLISEFLSPLTNEREDEYGGSLENRMRFGLEVVDSIRSKTGADFPIIVRMNGNDLMKDGLGRQELQEFARRLVDQGNVDAFCVNVGWHEASVPQITTSVPRAAFAYLARELKQALNVPIIASHRINDTHVARDQISSNVCDMVAMGRSLIADPNLPQKAHEGRDKEITHCVACAQGCFDNLFKLKHVECLCNPRAGHELEISDQKTSSPQKVLVVGGGPSGMTAALRACEKGHSVKLWEKKESLGGQLYLAAAPPGREEFSALAQDLATQVLNSEVEVVLNQEATAEEVRKENPDQVILTTGAKPLTFNIPGADTAHVCQAWDVLLDKAYTGQNVAIIGGGAVGVETALQQAEKGTIPGDALKFLLVNNVEECGHLAEMALKGTKNIVILEMLEKIGQDIGKSTKWTMMQDLNMHGVQTMTKTKALEITEQGVKVDREGTEEIIPADSVILAAGSTSYNPLQSELNDKGINCIVAGDANQVGLAFDAIHQGFAAADKI